MNPRTQALLEALRDACLLATPDGRIIGGNAAACQLLELSREELAGRTFASLAPNAPDEPRAEHPVTLARRDGTHVNAALTAARFVDDGAPFDWLVLRTAPAEPLGPSPDARWNGGSDVVRALSDAAFEGVLIHRGGTILLANRAAELLAGSPPGGLPGRSLFDFIAPESRAPALARIQAGDEEPYEAFGLRVDGSVYPIEVRGRATTVEIGGAPARVVAARDITARVALEARLRQSEKLEAIGRLAGGIAHDFNNLLAVVFAATALVESKIGPEHPAHEGLSEVQHAARRAAELTRRLLTFGRRQVVRPEVVEVGALVRGMESMLRRTLVAGSPEDIVLAIVVRDVAKIAVDPTQLELAILNLVLNARDALPDGGAITIEARRVGEHCELLVSDTGVGMVPAVREHLFEPFFTTKGVGEGTGLGLSTVFGIVNQSGGTIEVASEPGQGATFLLKFPCTDAPLAEREQTAKQPPRGVARTILLVEDEPSVRKLLAGALRAEGYVVLEAGSGEEALATARNHGRRIEVAVSDVRMPGMGGHAFAERLRAHDPSVRVVLMSGVDDQELQEQPGYATGAVCFLAKPFKPVALAALLGQLLAEPAHAQPVPPASPRG